MLFSATSATIYQIPCGDVDDLKAKLGIAVPGDALVLDACVYDTLSPDPGYNLGRDGPSWDSGPWADDTVKDKGIVITGTTKNPADTGEDKRDLFTFVAFKFCFDSNCSSNVCHLVVLQNRF